MFYHLLDEHNQIVYIINIFFTMTIFCPVAVFLCWTSGPRTTKRVLKSNLGEGLVPITAN